MLSRPRRKPRISASAFEESQRKLKDAVMGAASAAQAVTEKLKDRPTNPISVLVCDSDGKITVTNAFAEQVFGSDLIGRSVTEIVEK